MDRNEKIQNAVDNIIKDIRGRGWKLTRTTKKALAEAEALGLTPYLGIYARPDVKGAEIVNAVIEAAKDSGKKRTVSGWSSDGDGYADTITSEPSALYLALNEAEADEVEAGHVETIKTDSGDVVITRNEDSSYTVSSPYEDQTVATLDKAREVAAEMETILTVGWENS